MPLPNMTRPLRRALRTALTASLVAAVTLACTAEDRPPASVPTQAPASSPASLESCGQALCQSGGARFRWRGVTAFALAGLVADGKQREARAFVAWASRTGFTVLRVLAMNGGGFSLAPEEGRRALPQVFALAREHGLIVQVVALAGTRDERFSTEAFLREQVREVGRLCRTAGNCVLEIANEPYHSSQARLQDPALMRRLQEEVPAGLPVAWGAADKDDSDVMAGGSYVVVHLARSGDRWARAARVQHLAALARETRKFVVDNEPIGAAEADERNRRDAMPSAFFAQGALSRLFEVGSTFHCEDCLRARVPGPTQRRCAEAFIDGTTLVPDEVTLTVAPVGAPGTPVAPARSDGAASRVFTGVAGTRAWVVALGTAAHDRQTWAAGWRPVEHVTRWPGVEAWALVRQAVTLVRPGDSY